MPLSCFVLQTSSIRATFCTSPRVIVTNVVNPPDISPEIACFGLGLTTFVTGPRIERLKMLRFDDVCNIGRPGRDRPPRHSRFRLACSEDLAVRAAVSKRERRNIACNSRVSPSSCDGSSLSFQRFREHLGAGGRVIACDFGWARPNRGISWTDACCMKLRTPLLARDH